MSYSLLVEAIKRHDAKFIDLRFADLRGREQHVTIPVSAVSESLFTEGKMIDGSSFKGWKTINQSDLSLLIDGNSIGLDPFYQENTLFVRCHVIDPSHGLSYERCPRALAKRAEAYLKSTGIADEVLFGPEPEFFIFDDVRFASRMQGAFYAINSEEGHWNSGEAISGGNIGHRPRIKGGYFPLPPVDSSHDIRSTISKILESLGISVEAHHHEVATANQCEIATRFNSLTNKADELLLLKYVVQNVAHSYGKTATFMPKPLVGDNGSGMHCHQSLSKNGINLFHGDAYAGLSDTALYYIGGIIKHARALNAFTNPSINSYKRLIPGFEAPVLLAYSACNRSASIRIPYAPTPHSKRIEVRFPDATANPYLAFSAMMMAGLDGIEHKIHPGLSMDKDLYDLSNDELKTIPSVATSLEDAIAHLQQDSDFLRKGDVFSQDFIDAYVNLLKGDLAEMSQMVHPHEFELYFSA